MKRPVYNVHAYRYGNRESHSYLVGVYTKKAQALKAADAEESFRGGKYACEVTEIPLDEQPRMGTSEKIIKPLVKMEFA